MDLLLYAGIACILVTGLLSGAWTTGYQQRGSFYADSKDDRASKKKAANGSYSRDRITSSGRDCVSS